MKTTTIRIALTHSIAVAAATFSTPNTRAGDSVAISGDAKLIAIGRDDGQIELRASTDFRLEATLVHLEEAPNPASAVVHTPNLAFSPAGNLLASAVGASGVVLWDVAQREKLRSLPQPSVGYDLTFSADGSRLAGIGIDSKAGPHRLTLWDTGSGAVIKTLTLGLNRWPNPSANRFVCAEFDAATGTLAVGSVENGVSILRLLDATTGDVVAVPPVGKAEPDAGQVRGESPAIADGSYTFKVTHLARHPRIKTPHSRIAEEEFELAKETVKLQVLISDSAGKIEILPDAVSGRLVNREGAVRVYRLDEGLFAGGEFTVEEAGGGLLATFTKFGSGVPVIQSQRGRLARDE